MTWIKICGITNQEDARLALEAGADALGFIFAPSPRHVEPHTVREIVAKLPPKVEKIGVFVNETPAKIREVVRESGLTGVQLHGGESDFEIAQTIFPDAGAASKGVSGRKRLYLAFSMKSLFTPGSGAATIRDPKWQSVFDAVLVDSGSAIRRGGTGLTFDWARSQPFIRELKKLYKVIIAGGLNPENAGRAIELFKPWGVDVASGVEQEPGKKDPEKVRAFVAAVRNVKQ
jgi:phosphoribosylanthranilate isomerase